MQKLTVLWPKCSFQKLCAYTVQHKVQQTLGKQKLGVHPVK